MMSPEPPNFPVPFIYRRGSGTLACPGADHAVAPKSSARRKNRLAFKFDPSPADQRSMSKPTPHGAWWRGSPGPREGMPMMSRPHRAVRVDALELEGRLLLAALSVASAVAATRKPSPCNYTNPWDSSAPRLRARRR